VSFVKRQVKTGGQELTGGLALHPPAVSALAGTSILGWRWWMFLAGVSSLLARLFTLFGHFEILS